MTIKLDTPIESIQRLSPFQKKALSKMGLKNVYNILRYLGSAIFFVTAIAITILNFQGKLVMDDADLYGQKIRMIVFEISKYFQNIFVDLGIFLSILFIFYKLLKFKK